MYLPPGNRDEVCQFGAGASHVGRERSGVPEAAEEKQVNKVIEEQYALTMLTKPADAEYNSSVDDDINITDDQGCGGEADGRRGGLGGGHFLWAQGLQGE